MPSTLSAPAAKLKRPFPPPARLAPDLARVQAYWQGLLRGAAEMPFWDDVRLTDLPDISDRLFLLDVFARPERFRFASLGKALIGPELAGCFLDEVELAPPFAFLRSQATATMEAARPTFFRENGPRAAARLVLPLWGEGRISMLLGAVEFG